MYLCVHHNFVVIHKSFVGCYTLSECLVFVLWRAFPPGAPQVVHGSAPSRLPRPRLALRETATTGKRPPRHFLAALVGLLQVATQGSTVYSPCFQTVSLGHLKVDD